MYKQINEPNTHKIIDNIVKIGLIVLVNIKGVKELIIKIKR